jgi:hypothetical protein
MASNGVSPEVKVVRALTIEELDNKSVDNMVTQRSASRGVLVDENDLARTGKRALSASKIQQ